MRFFDSISSQWRNLSTKRKPDKIARRWRHARVRPSPRVLTIREFVTSQVRGCCYLLFSVQDSTDDARVWARNFFFEKKCRREFVGETALRFVYQSL